MQISDVGLSIGEGSVALPAPSVLSFRRREIFGDRLPPACFVRRGRISGILSPFLYFTNNTKQYKFTQGMSDETHAYNSQCIFF